MGIPFTMAMGFLLTATMGKLFTMPLGIQLTISRKPTGTFHPCCSLIASPGYSKS